MSLLNEFKKFAMRGSIVDLAIGFTVGAAFNTIAKSLVDDILMPPIGLLMGRADFADLFLVLKEGPEVPPPYRTFAAAKSAGAVTLNYGAFINSIVAFLIVALAMFLIIRSLNRIDEELDEHFGESKVQPEEPTVKKCHFCRSTIAYRAIRCPNCTSNLVDGNTPLPAAG
jgi:large conductance mechanosensitive channel